MTDHGNYQVVKKAKRKKKTQEQLQQEELRELLVQKGARRFIWTLLCECGIHNISFCGELTHETAFKEGQRNIGNKLIAMLEKAKPDSYMAIYNEFRREQKNS